MALLLGRHWAWITPEHLFAEMTLGDVRSCIVHILRWDLEAKSKEHYEHQVKGLMDWIAPGGKQDLSWMKRVGKVIRPHG